jgi:type IV pilus assembly protein PilY1
MPIAKALRRGLKFICGALLALYVMAPVYAFTPAQVPLLSASSVFPNLMLMVDNSGSMNHVIRDTAFNASTDYGAVYSSRYLGCLFGCGYVPSGQWVGENLSYSDFSSNGCGLFSSAYGFYDANATLYCLTLPNPAGTSTLISAGYLAFLITKAKNEGRGTTVNYRDTSATPVIPQKSRMQVAIEVSTAVVTANPKIRMGLATLNRPTTGGGVYPRSNIIYPVSDMTATGTGSDSEKLKTAIGNLKADGGTPLAETYYEITRYFRGMSSYGPSGLNYTSPIQYRCQKNYGVVVTDGLPSNDRTFPKNDPDDPNGLLPNWDGGPAANDGPNTGSNADGDTLYLDDLAKFAYDIDMRKSTGASISTPPLDLMSKSWDTDGFTKQNMSTYTVGFTVANQMLVDAAAYGHGVYYQANDSAGLSTALNAALSDISSKAGSGGGGAANSSTLVTGTRFFQTLYDPTDWHGTIKAFDLDSTTGSLNTSALAWTTDLTMTSSVATGTSYQSWNTDGSGSVIPLVYDRFSATQKAAIDASITTNAFRLTGTNLIDWSKGNAVTGLRTRTKFLGDIINSPLVAALPKEKTATDLVGDTTYTNFLNSKSANMQYSLLVNGNDGFMHVIDAVYGAQRYAYMPSTVPTSLFTLGSSDYGVGKHKFTVDGQISVFDTQVSAGSAWRTVAYGGLGAGGKAFFAVKLFEGTSNTIGALWEVKAPDDATATSNPFYNLGFTYSKPDVARMADGTGIVVVGNGYGSPAGRASLFVLNANTGALIREIPTPILNGETDNGLSSVKLRVNAQNVVQAAYAGDLKGHLWKFDMSGATAASWSVAFGGQPLFNTPTGAAQPITVQPLLLDHPNNGKLVYFGTGKFSETADKTTTAQQAFYAIWDADGGVGSIAQSNLQQQTVTGSVTGNGNTYFTTSNNDVDWNVKKGWYMGLATANPYLGERIIYPAQTSRGRIIFTTAAVNSSDPCESTGTGRLFELDAAKGGMLTYQVLDTNGDNDVTTADIMVSGMAIGTGIPNLASIVAGVTPTNDNKYLIDSSGGGVTKLLEKGGSSNVYQRIMWRQIQ